LSSVNLYNDIQTKEQSFSENYVISFTQLFFIKNRYNKMDRVLEVKIDIKSNVALGSF